MLGEAALVGDVMPVSRLHWPFRMASGPAADIRCFERQLEFPHAPPTYKQERPRSKVR